MDDDRPAVMYREMYFDTEFPQDYAVGDIVEVRHLSPFMTPDLYSQWYGSGEVTEIEDNRIHLREV